jgi:hypothetical protein
MSDMTEMSYVRVAAIGARRRGGRAPGADWRDALETALARDHVVSWWDASAPGATAYDVRRVQLRVAIAHRPHVVVLDGALAGLGRRDWDAAEDRSHLLHCAQVLSRRGMVLVTTSAGRCVPWHRSRAEALEAVYEELSTRFGTIHVDRRSSTGVLTSVVEGLSERGLQLHLRG